MNTCNLSNYSAPAVLKAFGTGSLGNAFHSGTEKKDSIHFLAWRTLAGDVMRFSAFGPSMLA
jgi:hypothetical protein